MDEITYYSRVSVVLNSVAASSRSRVCVSFGMHSYLLARLHASWKYDATEAGSVSVPEDEMSRAMAVFPVSLQASPGLSSHPLVAICNVLDMEQTANGLADMGYHTTLVHDLALVIGSRYRRPAARVAPYATWLPRGTEPATNGRVLGWMHVACMNSGDLIASELHGQLLLSGLYDRAEAIYVTLVGDGQMRDRLKEYLFSRYPKYRLLLDSPSLEEYEWPSMRDMWAKARAGEEFKAFYVHTKAASNCRPDVPARIQGNLRRWRECMSHFVIGKWKECLAAVHTDPVGAAGPLYQDCRYPSTGGIFAGNFWWANSEHLRKLQDPDILAGPLGSNRAAAEPWVCTRTGDFYHNLHQLPTTDPYDFNGDFGEAGPLDRNTWSYK